MPPVDSISIPKSARACAKGKMPVLSETLISARRMAPEFSVVIFDGSLNLILRCDA